MADAFPSISLIIPLLKEGDETAWNDLCDRFRNGLASKTRFLFRSTSAKKTFTAEDLIQETFLKAWKGHAKFQGESTRQFSQWILTILRNTFFDWCRVQKPETDVATWFGFSISTPSAASKMISLEQQAELHAALAELLPRYQQVLISRHFEGMKFAEIARATNTSVNQVTGLYRRGLRKLMLNIDEQRKSARSSQ